LRPKVLSLSTVFPRPVEPQLGPFVRARLEAAAVHADIQVLAPVPLLEYGNPGRLVTPLREIPRRREEGGLVIHHPRWFYPPLMNWANAAWLAWAMDGATRRLRQEFPFALIDAHWAHPEGGAAARLARKFGVPFTVTMRGNEAEHALVSTRHRVMAKALQQAAMVIPVSESLAGLAGELGVPSERIRVIPNGLDARIFHPRPREAARGRLGMEEGCCNLLTAGHLIELKGHHRVIEAAAALRAGGLDVRVWIAGGPGRHGNFAPAIEEAASRTGMRPYTRMLGALSPQDLAEAMSACDLFCLASSREGWPNVVNEALACGTPVVATRVGAAPEILAPEGLGVLVENNQPETLAAGIRLAAARQWDRDGIARHGKSRDWAHTGAEVAAVWRECLEGTRR